MNRSPDTRRGRRRTRRTALRTTVAAAVAVLTGCLVPAPASAEFQTAGDVVLWTAQYCPQNPTDPAGVATVHGDCWSPAVAHATFVQQTSTETAMSPAVWAYSGANDVLFNGAQPDTDVETMAWGHGRLCCRAVDSLLNQVFLETTATTNLDRVHATATVRAADVTKEQTVAVASCATRRAASSAS
jgi:hypothetical protein